MITSDPDVTVSGGGWPAALLRAVAAAARTFADELERGLDVALPSEPARPGAGTATSMIAVLGAVARINDESGRGAHDEEMREIARAAGMDPRGVAGYYKAGLLEKRSDGTRWISPGGRERLTALRHVHLLPGGN